MSEPGASPRVRRPGGEAAAHAAAEAIRKGQESTAPFDLQGLRTRLGQRMGRPARRREEAEEWVVTYMDTLTLILTFMVIIIMLADFDPGAVVDALRQQSSTEAPAPRADEAGGTAAPAVAPGAAVPPAPLPEGLLRRVDPVGEREMVAVHASLRARLQNLRLLDSVATVAGRRTVTLRIGDATLFRPGEAELTDAGRRTLDALVPPLVAMDRPVSVEGHTDDVAIATPRFPSNWELSSGRADAVVRFLAARGLAPSRLRAIGYGETRPLADNASPESRAGNRRVELVIHRHGGFEAE